jgi:hypothetical protein
MIFGRSMGPGASEEHMKSSAKPKGFENRAATVIRPKLAPEVIVQSMDWSYRRLIFRIHIH